MKHAKMIGKPLASLAIAAAAGAIGALAVGALAIGAWLLAIGNKESGY